MPLLTLLGQASSTHTIGGTSQLSGFGSSGGLNVFTVLTVGGTDQLAAFSATGNLLVESATTTRGGWLPPKRVKTKRRKKDEEILRQVYELVAKLEEIPAPQKLKQRVKRVEIKAKKAIQVIDTTQHDKQLRNTQAQIDRIQSAINTHIKAFKQDEDAAIKALLSII